MVKDQDLNQKIDEAQALFARLNPLNNCAEKNRLLQTFPVVQEFLKTAPALSTALQHLPPDECYIILLLIALGQGKNVFPHFSGAHQEKQLLKNLAKNLLELDHFYDSLGGILGYQLTILKLIDQRNTPQCRSEHETYKMPVGIDLAQNTREVRQLVRWGISALNETAELYPVGGAGDRLQLQDETTGVPLPVAALQFGNYSLLEGLLRDLQAKEYLHYKIHGQQINAPVAMMTSPEKNNRQNIEALCAQRYWFHRDPNSFRFFDQPSVPVVTERGDWAVNSAMDLMMKPGGHGVIWKLAKDHGIFSWFEQQGRPHVFVRQINNPLAGTDYGILGFLGFGHHHKKAFGFASCKRLLNAAEGMDVLVETKDSTVINFKIKNIDYTEFACKGIQDVPESTNSPYSQFPSNTNLLFANIHALSDIIDMCPAPGMLINMKQSITQGSEQIPAGRLESTMQNIADCITDHFADTREITPADLKTYITFNERAKTLSVTKKSFVPGNSLIETPEGCLYDLLCNHYDLLTNFCKIIAPKVGSVEEYLANGPSFLMSFHPALGPLYSIIAQKMHGGKIASKSELSLEIAELQLQNLDLHGSLRIHAENVMGHHDKKKRLQYSEQAGKCILRSVTVRNKGIDWSSDNQFWKHKIKRVEACEIIVQGNGEFFAEGVVFEGNHRIEVPAGYRVEAYMDEGRVQYRKQKIEGPTWYWQYAFDAEDNVRLSVNNKEVRVR